MTSDISITLIPDLNGLVSSEQSSNFASLLSNITVTGATISYGYNKIPLANVHIAAVGANRITGLQSLCDFDNFKRNPVILKVNTKNTCLIFRGIIDGNSISQQPGNLTASFIVKSNFTLLNEVYPRLIGANSATSNMFALPQAPTIDSGSASNPVTDPSIFNNYPFYKAFAEIYGNNVNLDMPAIRFLVYLCQILINTQHSNSSTLIGGTEIALGNFTQMVCALDLNINSMYVPISQLLKNIDASFTDGFTALATDALIGIQIQNDIAMLEDTMFRGLIRILDEYGCILVAANNKMFVIPNAPYLKPDLSAALPSVGQRSNIPNVAYPADYENFNFQDLGENTIKGVITVAEPMTQSVDPITGQSGLNLNGFFTEDLNIAACASNPPPPASTGHSTNNSNKVFGNIEVKTFPGLVTSYMTAALFHKQYPLKNTIYNGSTDPDSANISLAAANRVELEDANNAAQDAVLADTPYIQRMQDYLNNMAQIEYCKIKYGDRTGSISMPFNNNWVPGANGSLYTRSPGIRIDFFVTDVTHNFSVAAPNLGSATTSVSFMGGRPGASVNIGLPQLDLYQYSYNSGPYNSVKFCKAFLADLSTTIAAPVPPVAGT